MTDVFISYANEDRERAARLAGALGALGWSVWWDRKIIVGQAFDQAIERELETAKSVVVLWSNHSISSEWVKNEAAVAAARGVLVPATIESVRLPLEFRRKQTADLSDWNGEPSHPGFQALCEGVSSAIGTAPLHPPLQRQEKTVPWNPRWGLAGIAILVVAVGLAVYATGRWRTITSLPTVHTDRSDSGTHSENLKPARTVTGLADLVVGNYYGAVVSDSKGSSRSDVAITIIKLDRSTVRVTSDYRRVGTMDITLTRSGNKVLSAEGDTLFTVDLDQNPPTLGLNPRNELAYVGSKQK